MRDFENSRGVQPTAHDVFLLPRGVDQFSARPEDVRQVVVLARYPGEAWLADAVRELARELYVIDATPAGVPSAIVRTIQARARQGLDAAERQAWADGSTGTFVRGLGIGRPLGG